MKVSDINPHIRYAWLHRTPFKKYSGTSKCYDCRIFYFENTPGTITLSGINYNISNGTVIYLPPESEYELNVDFEENAIMIVLNFDLINSFDYIKHSLGTATKETFKKEKVPNYNISGIFSNSIVQNVPQLKKNLLHCVDGFTIKNAYYKETSSAYLKLSLLELIKDNSQITNSELCENVLSYIQKNYHNITLTNYDIATHFNYHPYHLSKIFKDEIGKTLHQFLTYYRLKTARELLLTTQYDIAEIAWMCGFSSPAHFTKMFHRSTGFTPREFRKINKNSVF